MAAVCKMVQIRTDKPVTDAEERINKYLAGRALYVSTYSRVRRIPQVNYMYSLGDEGNAVFALFKKIIPLDYWHMYLIAPIILGFLFTVHFIIKLKNKK